MFNTLLKSVRGDIVSKESEFIYPLIHESLPYSLKGLSNRV